MPKVDNKPLLPEPRESRPPIIPGAVKVAAVVVGAFVLIAGLGLLVASQGGFGLGAQTFIRSLLGNVIFQVGASSAVSLALLGIGGYGVYRQVRPPPEASSKRSSAIDSSSESEGDARSVARVDQEKVLALAALPEDGVLESSESESASSEPQTQDLRTAFIDYLKSDDAPPGMYGFWPRENSGFDFCQKLYTGITEEEPSLSSATVGALDSLRDVLPKLPIEQQKLVFVILHREKGEQFIKNLGLPPGSIVLCPRPLEKSRKSLAYALSNLEDYLFDMQYQYLLAKGFWGAKREEVERRLTDGEMKEGHFYVWESGSEPGAFGFYQKTGTSSRMEEKDLRLIFPYQPLINTIASLDINNPFGKKSSSPYDKQLILNLGSNRSARGMERKAKKQKLDSHTIDLRGKPYSEDVFLSPPIMPKEWMLKENDRARFYVTGHCCAGSDRISSDKTSVIDGKDVEKTSWTADQFAEFFACCCSNLKTTAENPIIVSLMSCESALSEGREPSFADRLSKALAAKGIHAIVKGRTDVVARTSESRIKNFHKLVRVGTAFRMHAEGAKSEFRTTPGDTETIITPATYQKRGNDYDLLRQ